MTGFEPTRAAALHRLAAFVPDAGRSYGVKRNHDLAGGAPSEQPAVSQLSPYLRHRLIAEREVIDAVLSRHAPQEAMPFLQQLFWRSYFKGWLEQHPSVWNSYQTGLDTARQQSHDGYNAAISGRSGIACFDHWCRQLCDTGYLHNHARLWFASIWIFSLRLPWQLGADLFLRHLADADPASNTLSWRWVAGLHTKGKHYLATADNIARFTDGRFHPVGELDETAPPLTEDDDHTLAACPTPMATPAARTLWLITEEDSLSPPAGLKVAGVLGIASHDASDFAQQAVRNSAAAAGGVYYLGHCWSTAILRAAETAGVRDVACAYLPVGPTADGFAATHQRLAAAGLRLHLHQRTYDRLVWPHATKGYFKLKKQIPSLIDGLAQ
ncbi:FAD-binding domain-containing protein [Thalassobius sp. Cn5-15]|uniref:FAD-binding domain-containing protein n=1 Tax=Thalassobius sp. Cn5-15 TaxID=2917763 RepID=UPI001EF31020|nr:FAD-binding domain-containing protein [Thalassobius sp. Cn5-15]MCG7492503.1 DNA photolyase [Thalassobius sp. Cn5-15]